MPAAEEVSAIDCILYNSALEVRDEADVIGCTTGDFLDNIMDFVSLELGASLCEVLL